MDGYSAIRVLLAKVCLPVLISRGKTTTLWSITAQFRNELRPNFATSIIATSINPSFSGYALDSVPTALRRLRNVSAEQRDRAAVLTLDSCVKAAAGRSTTVMQRTPRRTDKVGPSVLESSS